MSSELLRACFVLSLSKEYKIPGTCYSAGCMSYEFKVDYYLRNNPVEYSFVNFEQKCHLMKYSLFNCLKLVVEQLGRNNPTLLPRHWNLKIIIFIVPEPRDYVKNYCNKCSIHKGQVKKKWEKSSHLCTIMPSYTNFWQHLATSDNF